MKYPLNIRGKNLLSIAVIFIVSIAIVGAALWSMAILMVPAGHAGYTPHPAPALWMDPNSTVNLNKCDNFTVSIVVNTTGGGPLNNMYLWEYELYWNTSWLSVDSYTPVITAKPDIYLGWGDNIVYIKNDLNETYEPTRGRHWYAVSANAPAQGYVGVHWLCNYTFHVEEQPYEPAPAYTGDFDFHLEALSDFDLEDIVEAGDWVIGTFQLLSVPLPPPELKVKPKEVHGVCGENFNITIEINHLDASLNMCRWNATLSYNTTMLDAEASFEGPFLDGFGNANYTDVINDTLGTVYTTGFFVGLPDTPPNGTGVLAFIEFNASWQYTVPPRFPPVTCSLGLYNNNTVSCANLTINNTVINATYTAPYKTIVVVHEIEWPPGSDEFYYVFTESNSLVSPVPMIFNQPQKSLSFNVTGTDGFSSFCNVTIPMVLLNASWGLWNITLNGAGPTIYDETNNGTHVTLSFEYPLSTREVEIIGEEVIPEFPIAMILPLLFIATLTAAIFGKKVRSGKRRGSSVAE